MSANHPLSPSAVARPSVSTNLPVPAVALAIGAHPDDIEFQAGATLARWARLGCAIHHLVLTDGSKGSWDASQDPAGLVVERRAEQREAARLLGGGPNAVHMLGWPDGELDSGLRQRIEVTSVIRRVRPDVVLGHDPWRRYRLHPDHRNAGWLACDAIVAARDPHFFPEIDLAHHRPSALLLWEAETPTHVEIVDEEALAAKVAALMAHRSQFRSTHGIDDERDDAQVAAFAAKVRGRCQERGALADAELGEAFVAITEL